MHLLSLVTGVYVYSRIMDIVEELLELITVLSERQIAFAVCGGLAVAIHGRPRLTVDIDLVLLDSDMLRAIQAVAAAGFDLPTGWVKFPECGLGTGRLYRVTKVLDNDFLTLDLLSVDSQENLIWNDQVRVELCGREVPVLSKSALIRMKTASQRTKDRLDVELLTDEAE